MLINISESETIASAYFYFTSFILHKYLKKNKLCLFWQPVMELMAHN